MDGKNRAASSYLSPGNPPADKEQNDPLAQVFHNACSYNFFAMAELLHRLAKGEKGTPELSLRDDPAQETLRFSADASLAFPCSDISALKRDTSGAFRMTTTFMGLQGSQSPLPGYYLDHLAWKAVHEQSPVGDFLDMFSHRLTQFVWHIWRKYRYHISFRNGGVDAFSQRMYSLVGLGHRQLRDKLAINHSKMLAYSGILANPGRSPEIICGLVSHCFDLSEVTLQNWQRRKVDIEPDQQNSLGSYSLKNGEKLAGRSVLGNFVLGTRVPDLSGKFQLSITSLTRKQFLSFLPSGENFLPLTMFVSFILRDQLAWDLHLGLAPEQVGAMRCPQLEQLGAPPVLPELLKSENGLILVTGATGSGKSTTLAAMVGYLNQHADAHILTLEDPVEYLYASQRCLIQQREIGLHCMTFASGLRAALREDPDVILLGELRDSETIRLALTAAETGHLVLATLHTRGAAQAVERLVDSFPAQEKDPVRNQLAGSLRAVLSQKLEVDKQEGRVALFELLINTPAVGNLIREGKTHQLPHVIQTGQQVGMITFQQSYQQRVGEGRL